HRHLALRVQAGGRDGVAREAIGRAAVTVEGTSPRMEVRQLRVGEPGPGEVLVRIALATICGSDLHMWRGEVPWFQKAPGIQGHEMVGSIAELGPGRDTDSMCRSLNIGDWVA